MLLWSRTTTPFIIRQTRRWLPNSSRKAFGDHSRTPGRYPSIGIHSHRRHGHTEGAARNPSAEPASAALEEFKKSLSFHPATLAKYDDVPALVDKEVILHGYLGTRRDASKLITFVELHDIDRSSRIQLMHFDSEHHNGSTEVHRALRSLQEHTPVVVWGTVRIRAKPEKQRVKNYGLIDGIELRVDKLQALNSFPRDRIMSSDTVFPPEDRHLQIRQSADLRDALAFRGKAANCVRQELCGNRSFIDIETPVLFKSTPEGAREFLVPTRRPGFAYALPQSPQQYKQILMASGIPRYMQIARCFRDEDLRADRQPEFTQVDLEMAFAMAEDVMETVEAVVARLFRSLLKINDFHQPFDRMTYEQAMSKYGSDKPDLRFGAEIKRIDYMLPVDLVSKIGPLTNPAVEVMKFAISNNPNVTRGFINNFMSSPEARPFSDNPDGQPGIFIIDSRKPLQGLQPFGFEAAEQLEELLELQDGDLVVLQARADKPFSGGSTPIGNLRLALHRAAVARKRMPKPEGFAFTWITDFPLFVPSDESEPGQGGGAGLSSTHHPFTAPKTPEDVELLLTDPLSVTADHYDLVVNGVELGGGSRRIHTAEMQEFIMREVLKMSDERMQDFSHLIRVLRDGCPPHAGFALGFDRLVAVMLGKESVRDVIAFPKSGKGEDVLVRSPSRMTKEQLKTYHLQLNE